MSHDFFLAAYFSLPLDLPDSRVPSRARTVTRPDLRVERERKLGSRSVTDIDVHPLVISRESS